MMSPKQNIRAFIASPGDLAVERRAFADHFARLNSGFGDGAGVEFQPLGWEDTLAVTGRRPQEVINRDIDECDVFILALFRRWGQACPDSAFSSYTEEEFHRAYQRFRATGRPEIFIFFKNVDVASIADPGEQLSKVLRFRKSLEESKTVLYRSFSDPREFIKEVDQHLRAFVRGTLPAVTSPSPIVLPLEYIESVKKAEEAALKETARAEAANHRADAEASRAAEVTLALARSAATSALEGRIEQATEDFAKAITATGDVRVLHLAFEFFLRIGDLREAESLAARAIAGGTEDSLPDVTSSYGRLATIYELQGKSEKAEEMFQKALEAEERLNRAIGISSAHRRFARLHSMRGNFLLAEEHCRKSLAIAETLEDRSAVAAGYTNLSIILRQQARYEEAKGPLVKALRMRRQSRHLEGVAVACAGAARLHWAKKQYRKAERMFERAIQLDRRIGAKAGLTSDFLGMGSLHVDQRKLISAEVFLYRALKIAEELGTPTLSAAVWSELARSFRKTGDYNRAEEAERRALAMHEQAGFEHGVVNSLAGIGIVYADRGDNEVAAEYFNRALTMAQELEDAEGQGRNCFNMAMIERRRGNYSGSINLAHRSIEYFERCGDRRRRKIVEQWVRDYFPSAAEWKPRIETTTP